MNALEQMIADWLASFGWTGECIARLVLALLAGGLVGLEREVRGRQAGFRTNLLVCLGSAMVMIVSISVSRLKDYGASPGVNLNIDPARIGYGVMTGIGFLGAGTIIHFKGSVRGLTTAAALWCVAAVGLGIGIGLYLLAIITTAMIVLALWLLDLLEAQIPKVRYRTVSIRRKWASGAVAETVKFFQDRKLEVVDANFERTGDLSVVDIHLRIAFTDRRQYYTVERSLHGDDVGFELVSTQEM